MQLPPVTIIVLNYNGIADTRKCIRSLLKISYPNFSITVVDNGSTMNEAILLSRQFRDRRIEIVRFPKNFGFTEGNNKILRSVKTKYVVLVNNDVTVTPDFLEPLIVAMEQNKKIAVAQPKILWTKNKRYFDYSGACGGYLDRLGYPFTRGRVFNTLEKDTGQYNTVVDIFWASGAAMVVRTSIFKKIGYFDTIFFNYMEEIDLCFRINKAGYRIVCIPDTYVYHKVASTSSKNESNKRFWEHRNNLFMIAKNFPLRILLWLLPLRIAMDYIALAYYIYSGRKDYAIAVVKSHLSFTILLPKVLLRKKPFAEIANNRIKELMYPRSIVWSYFILKQQKFSQFYRLHE